MTPSRLGVFGGSFDPIHLGHLIIAEEARAALRLDRVLFVPARRSPLKAELPRASDADRAAMIELAIAGQPDFVLSRVELDRPAPSFTIDTLALLRAELGPRADLWLILGEDTLADFPAWRDPDTILAQVRLAVFDRPGYAHALDELEDALPGARNRVDRILAPLIGISATGLRARVADGRPIRYQVPPAVETYIQAHGLYRGDGPAGGDRMARSADPTHGSTPP